MRLKSPGRKAAVSAALAALAVGGSAVAAGGVPGSGPDQVTWNDNVQPTHFPQTDAEKQQGMQVGRALPQKELLQPTLDPALPTFHPAYKKNKLKADLSCASSDVLPGLAKAWVAKLHNYYPKVNISVDPPYAGSLGAIELIKGNLDFVFVSRELKPTDISQFHSRSATTRSACRSPAAPTGTSASSTRSASRQPRQPAPKLTFDQLDASCRRPAPAAARR